MHFFDTYALIEIIKGNPRYRKYVNKPFITSTYNLMELYYALLRLYDEKTAEKYFKFFRPACIPVGDAAIKEAMKFRLIQRSQKNLISYVDCIGYYTALELGILFLTGEKHFKNLKNVEYVK